MVDNSGKLRIAVIALLKPSQVKYKITPLLNSRKIAQVILFRKMLYNGDSPKLRQIVLPSIFRIKLIYWLFTPFYIAWRLRNEGIDLLLTYGFVPHAWYTYVTSKMLNVPFIYSQIDENVVGLHSRFLGKQLVELVLNASSQINVPGTTSQNYWTSLFDKKKINILHSTIDTNEYDYVVTEKSYNFIYVGVLTRLKRVDLLIRAIHLMKNKGYSPKLAIIGYGDQNAILKEYVVRNKLSDNVLFMGEKKVDRFLLSQAQVFCSASRSEGLPCALLEAMACKLVCITTPVGNIPDVIIEGRTGFFFDDVEPNMMAHKMLYVWNNYHGLDQLRIDARSMVVNNHSYSAATIKWDEVLKEYSNHNRTSRLTDS